MSTGTAHRRDLRKISASMMGHVVTADTRRKVSQTKTGMVFLPKEGFARGYQRGFAGLEYQGNANGSEAYAKGYAEGRANSERMAWLRTHSRTEGCVDARSSIREGPMETQNVGALHSHRLTGSSGVDPCTHRSSRWGGEAVMGTPLRGGKDA